MTCTITLTTNEEKQVPTTLENKTNGYKGAKLLHTKIGSTAGGQTYIYMSSLHTKPLSQRKKAIQTTKVPNMSHASRQYFPST